MAQFGRLKLFGVTIKRFLVQLKRHETLLHSLLPAELIIRYENSENRLFGGAKKSGTDRVKQLAQSAEDLRLLVEKFADNERVTTRTSYKAMARLLEEQCEIKEDKLELKAKPGGAVMQNPSDPDASYDGHKGQGYKAQLAQTSSPENPVQLITSAIIETAAVSDAELLQPQIKDLEGNGLKPEQITADTTYGSDENNRACAAKDIRQTSPVPGKNPQNPIPENPSQKDFRLAGRRLEEKTEEWKDEYKTRNAIEPTNSGIKRRTGLDHLRIRGKPAVTCVCLLKIAGWNIRRATGVAPRRENPTQTPPRTPPSPKNAIANAIFTLIFAPLHQCATIFASITGIFPQKIQPPPSFQKLLSVTGRLPAPFVG
jgi:hypothetical protein